MRNSNISPSINRAGPLRLPRRLNSHATSCFKAEDCTSVDDAPALARVMADLSGRPAQATIAPSDAASIIGRVIQIARKKGRNLRKLPFGLRFDFEQLCRQRDPAGLVVRDWLKGNRAFLPAELLELAKNSFEEAGQ